MGSHKQDMREAATLVFAEVCLESLLKNSKNLGPNEERLFGLSILAIARAWRGINANGILNVEALTRKQSRVSKALTMIWKGRALEGKIVLAALMDLGESVWDQSTPDRRKDWNDLIKNVQELFSSVEETEDDIIWADMGQTSADVVRMVAFDGMSPEYAVKVALEHEHDRGIVESRA